MNSFESEKTYKKKKTIIFILYEDFSFFVCHLFSFFVLILCSNLYIIVYFCSKSIFFYDIYVKEGEKKNLILTGLLPISINFIKTGKVYKIYDPYVNLKLPQF
jgi:hypothetical protein